MTLNFTTVPAALVGDRLVFRYSFNSTMSADLMTDVLGEIVMTGSSAKYYVSTSNFVAPYTQTNGAMTSMISGTLTKQ